MRATIISILIAAVLIGGAIFLSYSNPGEKTPDKNNVSLVDGKQIIDITAKGGYSPRVTEAQAGLPTTIRMNTKGTFDCSSFLVIPSLNYQANLSPAGVTEIELPPQKAGSKLEGLCSMGMYNFAIKFN